MGAGAVRGSVANARGGEGSGRGVPSEGHRPPHVDVVGLAAARELVDVVLGGSGAGGGRVHGVGHLDGAAAHVDGGNSVLDAAAEVPKEVIEGQPGKRALVSPWGEGRPGPFIVSRAGGQRWGWREGYRRGERREAAPSRMETDLLSDLKG